MEKIDNTLFTILIVDDMPKNLQILGNVLKQEGYKVEFATDGTKSLEWVKKKKFDLILLDIMMPVMNGFEACKEIRNLEHYDDVPIIFLTAKADKESVLTGFDLGAQDYITKPFDSRELLARVKTQLEIKYIRKKLETINRVLEDKVVERTLELKNANEELKKANDELLSLDKSKMDFLQLISHEIRTPLNGIIGPSRMIKNSIASPKLETLLNILDESVNRLEKFSLLAIQITALRMGTYKLRKSNFPLNKIVQVSVNELAEKIEEKKIIIDVDRMPSDLLINGELELIKVCIENLIENSIKYSDFGGKISIEAFEHDKKITCRVIDHGKGFSENALINLFKLFAPGEPHINQNMGLDLALVKLIMEAHSGEVNVSNSDDGGACVELTFNKNVSVNKK